MSNNCNLEILRNLLGDKFIDDINPRTDIRDLFYFVLLSQRNFNFSTTDMSLADMVMEDHEPTEKNLARLKNYLKQLSWKVDEQDLKLLKSLAVKFTPNYVVFV